MKLTLPNAEQEVTRRIASLSRDAMQQCAKAGGWTRQQVVAHLVLAHDATTQEIGRRLDKGSPTKRPRTMKERAAQFVMTGLGYFPPGRLAPEFVNPQRSGFPPSDGSGMASEYRRAIKALGNAIDRAEEVFGSKDAIATHPIIGPLSAGQWRRFHALHALHHTKQLDRIASSLAPQ